MIAYRRKSLLVSCAFLAAAFLFISPSNVFAATGDTSASNGSAATITNLTKANAAGFAGYASSIAAIATVQVVKASWIEPSVSCIKGTTNAQVGFLVGLATASLGYVILGTEGQCANPSGTTSTIYKAFFEFSNWCTTNFCGLANYVNAWSPVPGDHMSLTITRTSTSYTANIKDVTQGKSFTQNCNTPPSGIALNGSCKSIASSGSGILEWGVSEWQVCNPSCVVQHLANFGAVFFGKDSTGVTGTNGAKISGVTKTIKTASSTLFEYTMVSQTNAAKVLATTSALSTDGTSFSVAWKNAGP